MYILNESPAHRRAEKVNMSFYLYIYIIFNIHINNTFNFKYAYLEAFLCFQLQQTIYKVIERAASVHSTYINYNHSH